MKLSLCMTVWCDKARRQNTKGASISELFSLIRYVPPIWTWRLTHIKHGMPRFNHVMKFEREFSVLRVL